MQVIMIIHKYPRKRSEASVWVVEGAGTEKSIEASDYIRDEGIKRILCAHPCTDLEHAAMIADAWRIVIGTPGGLALVEKAHAEGF